MRWKEKEKRKTNRISKRLRRIRRRRSFKVKCVIS